MSCARKILFGLALTVFGQAAGCDDWASLSSQWRSDGGVASGTIPSERLPPGGFSEVLWIDAHPGAWETVDVTTRGVASGQDVTAPLRTLIATLTKPTILSFPAGTFSLSSAVAIHSNVIIKGAGPDQTIFNVTAGGRAFSWAGRTDPLSGGQGRARPIAVDIARGATEIPLADVMGISAGDLVMVAEDLDRAQYSWDSAKPSRGGIFLTTAVSATGITLNLPLAIALIEVAARHAFVARSEPVTNVGLEAAKVLVATADTGETLHVESVYNAYIKNVEIANPTAVSISVSFSHHVVISDVFIHDTQSSIYAEGGGILVRALCTRVLITNSIFKDAHRHLSIDIGSSHNITSYNYNVDTNRDYCFMTHDPMCVDNDWLAAAPRNASITLQMFLEGQYAHHNLFEGNVGYIFGVDGTHAYNGPGNTFMRNLMKGQPNPFGYFQPGVAIWIDGDADGQNIIANDLLNGSTISIVPNQGRTPIRTQSKDLFIAANVLSGAPDWGQLPASTTLPPSLYLSAKPSDWPSQLAWPPYGPDVANSSTNKIPAQLRYESR